MKKLITVIGVTAFLLASSPALADSINYGNVPLGPGEWVSWNGPDVWNLTKNNITLTYNLDMSSWKAGGSPWYPVEVGLRQVGGGNIDPDNIGGWLFSYARNNTPSPGTLSNHDYHGLMNDWSDDHTDYNVDEYGNIIAPPFGTSNVHAGLFDRDSVDAWQALLWGMMDGVTYNTNGIYNIELTFHAVSDTLGTMFAKINGESQGIYNPAWHDGEPEYYPAGLSFTGDMTQMQVFVGGRHDTSGQVSYVYDLTATQVPIPGAVLLGLLGLGAAGMRLRRHA